MTCNANATWAILSFFSGAAALIYQVLWVKQLSLVVGVDAHAVAAGVAAFFMGLALGGFWLGRASDRVARPALLFATLEGAVALLGPAVTFGLFQSAPLFVRLRETVGLAAWLLPFLLVGGPAFFMGGSLPALLRLAAPDDNRMGRTSGALYAANAAGAIAGVLAAVFVCIPALGITGAGFCAAALNLGTAGLALVRGGQKQHAPRRPAAAREPLCATARTVVVLYGLAGGVALGYEVVWSQAMAQFLSTRAYAFAIMLAVYLLGLSLGAALYARVADRITDPERAFGLLIAAAGICGLSLFALLGPWLEQWQLGAAKLLYRLTDDRLAMMCARFAVAAGVLVLPPTLFLGAAFPAAVRLIARGRQIGADSGLAVAWNTAGGVVGTLVTGFVLIPALGLVRTLSLLALLSVVIGAAAVVSRKAGARSFALAGGLIATVLVVSFLTPADKLGRLLASARGGTLLYYDESAEGAIAVLEQQSASHTFRRLYIQGVSNSGDTVPSLRYMRLQGLVPLLVHGGEPRSALVIGLGTGITAGSLLAYPLERRECVELAPAVVTAASLFRGNLDATADPRLAVHLGDGRHYLLATNQRFDMITLEPPPPSARGVVNLYSREFYELARDRLAPGGILAQWFPIATQNEEDLQAMLQSMLAVFPHATMWSTDIYELMVLGSMEPMECEVQRIAVRCAIPGVKKALAEIGIAGPAELLATYVLGRDGMERFAGGAKPVTDDRPRIEYAPWVRPDALRRVLPRIMALANAAPLRSAAPGFGEAVQAARTELFDFYRATLAAAEGDREQWRDVMRRVLSANPDNPYYRWFLGG